MLEFTFPQIEGAIIAIDRRERRERLTRIFDYRISQADSKGFKEAIKRLEQQDKLQRLQEARRKGLRLPQGPRTEKELRVLQAQGHATFRDLPPEEQRRLEREREQMWASVPKEFLARSQKLAGVS